MKVKATQFNYDYSKEYTGPVEVTIYAGPETFFEFVLNEHCGLHEASARVILIIKDQYRQGKLDIDAVGLFERFKDELFDEILVELAYENSDIDDDYRTRIVHVIDTENESTCSAYRRLVDQFSKIFN